MRAYLVAPIREAAQVYVNGKLAGTVWRPPYRLDVTQFVHAGQNDLRIDVGNTAINALTGHPQPDYRLLWDRYGMLFVPQDMENLVPLPSGILGPVKLMESIPIPGATAIVDAPGGRMPTTNTPGAMSDSSSSPTESR